MFPKRLEIRSKDRAAQFKCNTAWVAISVATKPTWPDLQTDNRRGFLRIAFSDFSYHDFSSIALLKGASFDRSMAFQVLEFIHSMWDRADTFLITSERGESRAPAIAAAICRIQWGEGWEQHFLDQHQINHLVYHMLLKAYFDPCGYRS